jgi:hypothetical protein
MPKIEKDGEPIKRFTMPISYKMWAEFRQIAFDHQMSMSQMVRQMIDKIINKYGKNKIDNK